MRAFVTGATGFVGSHLVSALLDRGDEVSALVRDPTKARRLFSSERLMLVRGDLGEEAAIARAADGADVAYHVAGLTAARNRDEFFAVNATATERVARVTASAAPGLRRFVYVSSLAAVGPTTRGHVAAETVHPRPVSAYGSSKLAGEEAVRQTELPWTIVRPPTVYGPRDRELLRLFRLARRGIVPVPGGAEQELSLVYAEDLSAALLLVPDGSTERRTYFVCHPEIVTARRLVREVHGAVRRAAGRSSTRPPMVVSVPGWLSRVVLTLSGTAARMAGRATVLSRDKANELLAEAWTCTPQAFVRDTGWRALVDARAGCDRTARWYGREGWL